MSHKEIKRHDKAIILDGPKPTPRPTPLPIYNLNHTTQPFPVSSSSQGQTSSSGAQGSWRLPREEDLEQRLGSTGQILNSIRMPYKEINKQEKAILLPKPIPRPTPKTLQLFPMSSNSQGQTSFLGSQGSYKLQREEDFELLLESTALNQNGILNQDQTVPFKNQNTDAMPEVHAGRDVAPEYMRLGGESSNRELEVEIEEIKLMCVICLGEMEEETSTLCGHIFCKDCIMSAIWMKRRCPVCLTPLSIGSIHRIFLPTGDCHSLI